VTVRWKLALLYGLLFLVTGTALVAVSYQLVQHDLPAKTVVAASNKDVLLRAQKMARDPDFSATDRAGLDLIIQQPEKDTLNFVRKAQLDGVIHLSPNTLAGLTSDLSVTLRDDALHQLLLQSCLVLGAMSVLSVAVGWFVSGRVLRPVRRITATAAELTASDLDRRIALTGPDDELTRLARTFDAMLDRLAASFEGQRRFVAHASHELRTPLTVMATEIDVTLRQPDASTDELRRMAAIVRTGVDRSDRVITSLLALARVEGGPEVVEDVDLCEVAQEALHRRSGEVAAAGITVTVSSGTAPVAGDPGLLDRLAENLIENAIVHNVPGGWMRVRTAIAGDLAELEVASSGSVVAAEDLPRLFTPFEQVPGHSAGSGRRRMGLGLSIVRAVATAHAGTADADRLPEGGLRVVVRLPMGTRSPRPPGSDQRSHVK
jgi:signal transduction histidine kinase